MIMQLANLLGRGLVVDHSLLSPLNVDVTTTNEKPVLHVSGSIMESAKVYQGLRVTVQHQTILLTVLSSLMFWKRSGSPDFDDTYPLNVPSGTYRLEYIDQSGNRKFLKSVKI